MKTIQLTIEQAKSMYGKSKEMDELLLANFTKQELKPFDWHDIKTFKDACDKLGINLALVYNNLDSPDEIAYKKLKVIAKAINQGWVPDLSNGDEYKYYPWFDVLSSEFCFSASAYDCGSAGTLVGSQLCFGSREKSNHAATQFIDLYKQFLL